MKGGIINLSFPQFVCGNDLGRGVCDNDSGLEEVLQTDDT